MLNERDIKIAEEIATGTKSITQICRDNQISRTAFYNKMKENLEFAALVKENQQNNKNEAKDILVANGHRAAQLIVDAIEGSTRISKPRLDAARDLLDRIGLNPSIRYQVDDDKEPVPLNSDDIKSKLDELKNRRAANE